MEYIQQLSDATELTLLYRNLIRKIYPIVVEHIRLNLASFSEKFVNLFISGNEANFKKIILTPFLKLNNQEIEEILTLEPDSILRIVKSAAFNDIFLYDLEVMRRADNFLREK